MAAQKSQGIVKYRRSLRTLAPWLTRFTGTEEDLCAFGYGTGQGNSKFEGTPRAMFEWARSQGLNAVWCDPGKSFGLPQDIGARARLPLKTPLGALRASRAKVSVGAEDCGVPFDLLSRRTWVIQGFHGTPLKAIGRASTVSTPEEIRIVERADFLVSSGPEYTRRFRMCFKIAAERFLEVGNPRNDVLASCDAAATARVQGELLAAAKIPGGTKIVVYAPTWRPWGTDILPFEDRDWEKLDAFLESRDAALFLKGHHRESIAGDGEYRRILSSARLPINWDAQTWLISADALITDFSSIFFDYLILDRPVIYIPYDHAYYEQRIGFVVDPHEDFAGPSVRTQAELVDLIDQALSEPTVDAARRAEVNHIHNPLEDGQASARAGRKLIELLAEPRREG